MTAPANYPSATPRFGLPLLFPGQAQKEFFVNAASSLCDVLLHPAIEGVAATPPAGPVEGQCWLVADNAGGDFAGHQGALALRSASGWLFVAPRDGLRLYDRAAGQFVTFAGSWQRSLSVAAPTDGETIDVQARSTIAALIDALAKNGIIPEN